MQNPCEMHCISRNQTQDHQLNIDGKILCRKQRSKSESYNDHSASSSSSNLEKKQSESDWQTPSHDTGMSPLSRAPNGACWKLTPFKTPGSDMLTFFKTLVERVTKLNPKKMVPVNEFSLVISDPQRVKAAPQLKEQPTKGPPPKGSRFNPIYVEPGSTSIQSTRDLQALFPNSFNCIGGHVRQIWHQTDPTVLPVQHGRHKVPIEYKDEIEKEIGKMVWQGIITKQTEPAPWVSSLTYQKKTNGKLRICLKPKDLNKAIIR